MSKHEHVDESGSDDDETVAGSDSGDPESESEEFQVPPPLAGGDSESEDGKESESDSDPAPTKPDPESTPHKRPVVVESSSGELPKKAEGNESAESESESEPGSKSEDSSGESDPDQPEPESTARKRTVVVESSDGRVPKKAKGNVTGGEEDEKVKKQLFQRIWSDDDAVALLKAMVAFKGKKGVDPVSDLSAFRNFLNKSLNSDFEIGQVTNKIRSLRDKFRKYAGKELGGKEMDFRKASDIQVYKLSKDVWGMDGIVPNKGDKENDDDVEVEQGPEPDGVGRCLLGRRCEDVFAKDEILKNGWKLVASSKRAELEKRWEELMFKELDLVCMKAKLTSDQVKAVLEAVRLSYK